MEAPEPESKSGYAATLAEIRGILADTAIVACFVLAIFGIDILSHTLMPPDGPILFHHTRFEIPFQWMIDTMHFANFGTFIIRVVWRMWR